MIDSTVFFLTLTDQADWCGASGAPIDLSCRTDIDANWYAPLCHVFREVVKYDLYRGIRDEGLVGANAAIIDIAKTYCPKYVVYPCNFVPIVTHATLAALRDLGCVIVAWFFDDEVYFDSKSRWMIGHVDYCVTLASARVRDYEKLGARCVCAVPIPMNVSVFKRLESCERKYDTTFVGGLYHGRKEHIERMRRHGVDVTVFGGNTSDTKLHYREVVKIFNQSRINLNFSSNANGSSFVRQLKGRIFEVPLSGGFLLTEYAPDLERFFELDREVACFETEEEAVEKIKYYLEHAEEREEIARRGYDRARRDYAGEVMLQKVFDHVEKDLKARGRPTPAKLSSDVTPLQAFNADGYFGWVEKCLKEKPSLRGRWLRATEIVLAANPTHPHACRLLKRYKKWGDPEGIRGWYKRGRWRLAAGAGATGRFLEGALGLDGSGFMMGPRRLFWAVMKSATRHLFRRRGIRPGFLFFLHRVGRRLVWRESPLLSSHGKMELRLSEISDERVRMALGGEGSITRWSLDVRSLNWLVAWMKKHRPARTLEFGSGLSTVAMAAVISDYGLPEGKGPCPALISIEQEQDQAERTRKLLGALQLDHVATVIDCPLVEREFDGKVLNAYQDPGTDPLWPSSEWRADMMLVDGPCVGSTLARALAVADGLQLASPESAVIMDDAFRCQEVRCIRYLQSHGLVAFGGILPIGKGLAVGRSCRPSCQC